jgi:hypothetical protein
MIWEILSIAATAAAVVIATLAGVGMQRSVNAEFAEEKDSAAAFAMVVLIVAIGLAATGWWLA